jgi:hypothetical protein
MAKRDSQHPRTDQQARLDKIEWLEAIEQRITDLETRANALEGQTTNE